MFRGRKCEGVEEPPVLGVGRRAGASMRGVLQVSVDADADADADST